jgi:hypothetical protein
MARSLYYFLHFGVVATPAPADFITTIPAFVPLGYHFTVADIVMHEYIGVVRYYIYNFLGWNGRSRPSPPRKERVALSHASRGEVKKLTSKALRLNFLLDVCCALLIHAYVMLLYSKFSDALACVCLKMRSNCI